jgi:tripartite ATP-independent transporter DctP family solute receptor
MRKIKNGLAIYIAASLMFLIMLSSVGCGTTTAAKTGDSDTFKIRIAHASSEDSATQKVCEAFKEKAEELLPGEVEVTIYPNATLGSEAEMVEAMQMGTLDAGTFGRHSAIDSRLDVLNLPFLFESDEQAAKVLRGEEGEQIREDLNEIMLDNDIMTLGWYETGFREITSNKKIETIDDLKGLLIRTPSTETLIQSFEAWGASPTAVDLSELYTSLQSGVVDAQENPYQLIDTNKLYEVQKYLCVTDHLTIPNQLVFSKKIWASYSEEVQEALKEAGEYACGVGAEYNIEKNSSLLDELSKKMTVTYMDEASLDKMKEIAYEQVWPQFLDDEETQGIVEAINEVSSD